MSSPSSPLAAMLTRILAELKLPATADQHRQLLDLVALLHRWNGTYNLTSIRAPSEMLLHHVADCLAVIGPLDRLVRDKPATRFLDVGSGAGFPGSVIAVMRPEIEVTCIDSVGKKAAFIRQTGGQLGLANLRAEHGRVQDLKHSPYDVIASRALSDLQLFTQLTNHLLAPDGIWMAMKGKVPSAEIETLGKTDLLFHVEQLRVPGLDADRCLVWVKRVKVSPSSRDEQFLA